MPLLFRLIGILVFAMCTSTIGFSQSNENTHTLVVILKNKDEASKKSNPRNLNQFKKLKVDSYQPMFRHSNPNNKFRKKHTIDLSVIYEVHFNANVSLEEAIRTLESTGLYSSVEPKYNNHIYYQPNDPKSDSTLSTAGGNFKQNQLEKHDLFKAWDISKGDTNITIGIIDTGFDFDHEDLGNIAYNTDDTINGIDDDGDMALDSLLLDNYRGWDVSDWDNDPTYSTDPHGVQVAGCSSGECDNGLGVCGTGFLCRYLPIKVAHDSTNSVISHGYQGIVYAAEQGCDIINLSWGNEGIGAYMTWQQAVINYAAIDYDAVIVAAAGNTSGCLNFYPASYNNVISVASLRFNNLLVGNATYGYYVDVNALGANAHTTQPGGTNTYGPSTGSSFASPIVAGVAGLIRSHRPELNALQVGELIRVTGDKNDDTPGNENAIEKMGKNLNAHKALLDTTSSSVRTINWQFEKSDSLSPFDGDTMLLVLQYQNYLAPVSNLSLKITSANATFTTFHDSIYHGDLGTLDTSNNISKPFIISVNPGTNLYDTLLVRVEYEGDGYSDYQYLNLPLWETYRFNINQKTTLENVQLSSCDGKINTVNDTLDLAVSITNNLIVSDSLIGTLSSLTPNILIIDSVSDFEDAMFMDTVNNFSNPYRIVLNSTFNHGDTLIFSLQVNSNNFTESYTIEVIIDTNSIDTMPKKVILTNLTYSNSSGSLTFAGDSVKMEIEVYNPNCDIVPYTSQIKSLDTNISLIDSIWNISNFNSLDTINNYSSLYQFFVDPSANSGDTVYFQLTHTSGQWSQVDTISLILADTNVVITKVKEEELIKFLAYPNPFDNQINLKTDLSIGTKVNLVLYDELLRPIIGDIVSVDNNQQLYLNTQQVPTGYYILIARYGDQTQRIKLVKIGQ